MKRESVTVPRDTSQFLNIDAIAPNIYIASLNKPHFDVPPVLLTKDHDSSRQSLFTSEIGRHNEQRE